MTRRNLKGPASARGNQKQRNTTSQENSKQAEDKDIDGAESSESNGQQSTEANSVVIKTENIPVEDLGQDSIIDKTREMLEEDDDSGDDLEDFNGKLMSEDDEDMEGNRSGSILENDDVAEDIENAFMKTAAVDEIRKLTKLLNAKLRGHIDKVKTLKEEKEALALEKADLSAKYKKYKEMAIKLKNQSSGGASSDRDLEEENQELKMKLKDLVDKLQNEEESKGDANSKLHLKDVMLQKEREKYEDLEAKFKKFLMKFHQKFNQGNNSLSVNAMSSLQSSLAESKVEESLSEEARSKTNQIKRKVVNDPKPPAESKSSTSDASRSIDAFRKSIQENISNASSTAKASSKVPIDKEAPSKSKPQKNESLNKTLPTPEAPRPRPGPASKRKSIAMSKVSTSAEVSKSQTAPTPVSAKDISDQYPKPKPTTQAPTNNLPSKLLSNSSISLGSVSVEKKQETPQQPSKSISSSASSKLSKLGSINSSISFSPSSSITPSSPAAQGFAKLNGNSSISMVKSPSIPPSPSNISYSIPATKPASNKDSSQLLRRQGISFSKVSSETSSTVATPPSKAPPTKRLSNLKGLNISLSKPGSGSPAKALPPAPLSPLPSNLTSALVPVNNDEEPPPMTESPRPMSRTESPRPMSRTRRGPASAKRKAETELKSPVPSSKQRVSLKLLEEISKEDEDEDEDMMEDSIEQGRILSLTHESDKDPEDSQDYGDDHLNGFDVDNDDLMKKLQNVENELENQLDNLPFSEEGTERSDTLQDERLLA